MIDWHMANLEYGLGTELKNVSVLEWDQDDGFEFKGAHCLVPAGYGHIAESLSAAVNNTPLQNGENRIEFNSVARKITWSRAGVEVQYTQNGNNRSARGDLCVITLPLGVLKANAVEFYPPLPAWKQKTIDRMGFGNLNKVVLTFPSVFWEETDFFGITQANHDARGQGYIFWNLHRCMDKPVLVALLAGKVSLLLTLGRLGS